MQRRVAILGWAGLGGLCGGLLLYGLGAAQAPQSEMVGAGLAAAPPRGTPPGGTALSSLASYVGRMGT
jgi:hypothetical protein